MQRTETCLKCGQDGLYSYEVVKCDHCHEDFCAVCIDDHETNCVHNPNPNADFDGEV